MRDIRIPGVEMRDENVPATPSIIDGDMVATSPKELDEKDKPAKRFAERIPQPGPSTHDWKEKN